MAKKKKKKKEKIREEEKPKFPNKKLIIISAVLTSVIVLGFIISFTLLHSPEVKFSLKAAIIDQLGGSFPNSQFVTNVANVLKTRGFEVYYYKSEEVNVSFFYQLAKNNYGIIILRAHSALRNDNSTVDLFTSEPFNNNKYVKERKNGLLVEGILNYSQNQEEYFAVTSRFIENLEGTFPKSVVIAMGCWSLKPECKQMAEAFHQKGAMVYIGWTEMVKINHTDVETVKLLRMLLEENKTIEKATEDVVPDRMFGSKMEYYPTDAGSLRISSLIKEVNASSVNYQASTSLNLCCVFVTNVVSLRMRKVESSLSSLI